jgi:putative hydrolase of the HAD superfamily
MLERIKVIVFDVDDVLINGTDENGCFYWTQNINKDLGINKTSLQKLFLKGWQKAVLGRVDTVEIISNFLKEININITPQQFITYWLAKDSNIDRKMFKAAETLKNNGYLLYLGTVQEKYRSRFLWEELGFKKHFKDIYASCFLGCKKPQKDYFNNVQKRIGVSPEQILLIDDKEKNIEGALNAGWQGYLHKTYEETDKNLFNFFQKKSILTK